MTVKEITPEIAKEEVIETRLSEQVEEAGMIVVHCRCSPPHGGNVRVWPATFLLDRDSPAESKLLHVFGVSVAPEWTHIPPKGTMIFTLVFEPLPKTCTVFNFVEKIPLPGAFRVDNIPRNKADVYRITIM